MARHEALLLDTFVTLADNLVEDFDVVDVLSFLAERSVALFDADAAGVMLADSSGQMQLIASSSHQMRFLELLELQHDDGPCPDAFSTGQPVACDELRDAADRWPTFAPAAAAQGFRSAQAIPIRLRDKVIGAFNLFGSTPGALSSEDLDAARALADVAAVSILQQRASEEAALVSDQLRLALSSRVVIEQAKGVVAESLSISTDEAFDRLRSHSRRQRTRLTDVAAAIVDRRLDVPTLIST